MDSGRDEGISCAHWGTTSRSWEKRGGFREPESPTGSALLVGGFDRRGGVGVPDLVNRLRPDGTSSGPSAIQSRSAYEGLRPWGLAIGPSKILPTARIDRRDLSTNWRFAWIPSSLRNWQPVLALDVRGVRLDHAGMIGGVTGLRLRKDLKNCRGSD